MITIMGSVASARGRRHSAEKEGMMTMDVIAWQDIDHGRQVQVVADDDARPYDADCYSPEDIDAWRRGLWRFVGVLLLDADGTQLASVWGVEFGEMPGPASVGGGTITIDHLVQGYPVQEMLDELPTPHIHPYRRAVWAASGIPGRPAIPTKLHVEAELAIAITPLAERNGAWGSCVPRQQPDGQTVPVCVVHVRGEA